MRKKSLLVSLILLGLLFNRSNAQNKNTTAMNSKIASTIFTAWQKGEAGNGYQDFRNFMDEGNFKYFSHPLSAVYKGKDGYDALIALINGRETKPNHLNFSNIVSYQNGSSTCFQFDSEGKVADGFYYKGYNIIQLEIENNKLIGFREYFGFIDPVWFKKY